MTEEQRSKTMFCSRKELLKHIDADSLPQVLGEVVSHARRVYIVYCVAEELNIKQCSLLFIMLKEYKSAFKLNYI